jgi:hypothetical protein
MFVWSGYCFLELSRPGKKFDSRRLKANMYRTTEHGCGVLFLLECHDQCVMTAEDILFPSGSRLLLNGMVVDVGGVQIRWSAF